MKQLRTTVVMIFSLFMLAPVPSMAASVLVSWNANLEPDLAGYRVYYGFQSGQYGTPRDVGNTTSYQGSVPDDGTTYYIAVTAYDTSGNESGFSKEVSISVPAPDTTPPAGSIVISQGNATTPTRVVTLTLNATDAAGAVTGMRLSNDGQNFSDEVAYTASQQWVLTEGDGLKRVYVLFKDAAGNWMSAPVSDSIELQLDSDGDGLPDSWESSFAFDSSNPDDAGGDSDNDGISNLEEYYNDTDPRDASDNLPVASAGPDQSLAPTRVYLEGSASFDPNGDPLEYAWSSVTAPAAITLENRTAVRASFVGVKAGLYRFMLSCFDGKASATDTVDITILNAPPSVEAGSDMTVDAGETIALHASGSDPNGDTLGYAWSLLEGPEAQLPDLTDQDISLTLMNPGIYRFSVVCSDGVNSSPADEMLVTVNDDNHAPTAIAGTDADVQLGARVTLDGSRSSDPDGDELEFAWIQVLGPAVAMQDATTSNPWFDADAEGTFEFELVVTDGFVSSVADRVIVRVLQLNNAPVAAAGDDQHVYVGDLVTFDAAGSFDPDNDTLSFSWSQTSGASVELAGADSDRPSFTPTTSGVLEFTLEVSDGQASSQDSISVTVDDINQVPVADAGDDCVVNTGETLTLDGSRSSDPDGDAVSFIWSQLQGPRVSLSSSNSAAPSFVPAEAGVYVFELKVYDGTDTSSPDTVTVTVQADEAGITPLSPEMGAVVSENPTFSWAGNDSITKYKLYVSLKNNRYYNVYTGSNTTYTMHPVLWYWFIPSGTSVTWYADGYTSDGQVIKSEVFVIRKQ